VSAPRIIALLLAATATSPVTAAGDLYTHFFAGVNGGKPCYLRVYDDAHLKSHRKQAVRRIFIDFDASVRSDTTRENGADDFEAGIGFMLKPTDEWYGQALSCKAERDRFECSLEADGGSFTLTPRGEALRLEVTGGPDADIHTEGASDFGSFGGRGSDDRVFILSRGDRKTCDAAFPK
jgi:hypothetical protein